MSEFAYSASCVAVGDVATISNAAVVTKNVKILVGYSLCKTERHLVIKYYTEFELFKGMVPCKGDQDCHIHTKILSDTWLEHVILPFSFSDKSGDISTIIASRKIVINSDYKDKHFCHGMETTKKLFTKVIGNSMVYLDFKIQVI